MALDSAPSMQLVYKAHSSSAITPGTEPTFSSDPGASSATILRRTRSTLAFTRSTFQSQEYRSDMQVNDYRLGGKRVTGSISGELSPLTYQDFCAAAMRASWTPAVAKSESDFTSLTISNSGVTLTVGGSTWAAQGYRVGQVINLTNMSTAANNNVHTTITALSGTAATVYPPLTDQSADAAFNVTTVGRHLAIPVSSHVSSKFAFEHSYLNGDLSHLFTECRIGGMRLGLPAEGVATVEFPVMGRNMTAASGGSAPFFTSPTVSTTTTVLTTIGGALTIGGTAQGIITAASVNLDLGLAAPAVAFNSLVPDIFYNTMSVSGQITALLYDNTHLTSFINESEVEIALRMTTGSAANSNFISLFLPRVKFTGGTVGDGALDGSPITLPFTALIKPSTTGYDNTTMTLQDSQSA